MLLLTSKFMKKFALIPISILGVALVGCAPTRTAVHDTTSTVVSGHMGGAYKPKNTDKYDLENQEPFVLMDVQVQRSITVAGIEQGLTPEGRLKVNANLRNRLSRPIEVQVSCVFKGPDGFSTGDETPWEAVSLTENAQEGVSFVAMNNAATKFTIRVRQVR